jgi:hypothetical protein
LDWTGYEIGRTATRAKQAAEKLAIGVKATFAD